MDDALKTRGIIYLNIETWLLFAPPPYKNLWLRASPVLMWPSTHFRTFVPSPSFRQT